MNSTIPKTPSHARSLMLGAEIWASYGDDSDLVRRVSAPSIDSVARVVGSSRSALADRITNEAIQKQSPIIAGDERVAAIAWPVLDRKAVNAVVVCYFSLEGDAPFALERWEGRAGRSELCLGDALYSGLDRFKRLSPHIAFPKGAGLPGLAWESGLPRVMPGLSESTQFMRASTASAEGLDVGLALPLVAGNALRSVVLMLCGPDRPLARAIEIWQPESRGESLRLKMTQGVYPDASATQHVAERGLDIPAGDGWIGRAWASRQPELVHSEDSKALEREGASDDGLSSGLAIPMITLDDVRSLLVLMW